MWFSLALPLWACPHLHATGPVVRRIEDGALGILSNHSSFFTLYWLSDYEMSFGLLQFSKFFNDKILVFIKTIFYVPFPIMCEVNIFYCYHHKICDP